MRRNSREKGDKIRGKMAQQDSTFSDGNVTTYANLMGWSAADARSDLDIDSSNNPTDTSAAAKKNRNKAKALLLLELEIQAQVP